MQTYTYFSLDAQEHNSLSSGDGGFKKYSRADLELSLKRLNYIATESDISQFQKVGRNPFNDLLGVLTGSEVLENGTIIENSKGPKVMLPVMLNKQASFCVTRVRAFINEILNANFEEITIDFD
jgi:hypothetical protein